MNFEPLLSRQIHPAVRAMAEHCQEIAAGNALPRRQDFRPSQVRGAVSYLFLADARRDTNDYYFSLGGENIATLFGRDLANTYLSQLDDQLRARLQRTYDFVLANQTYQYVYGRYVWPDQALDIERLLVPMTGKDGSVNTVLGLVVPGVPEDVLAVFTGVGAARLEIDEEFTGNPPQL